MVRQPFVETLDAPIYLAVLLPRQTDVQAGRGELAELEYPRPRLFGNPQNVADHGDWQLRAILVDHVDRGRVVGEIVEKRVRGLLNPIPQCGNRSGGEHGGHQLAVPGVVGRFYRKHRRRLEWME